MRLEPPSPGLIDPTDPGASDEDFERLVTRVTSEVWEEGAVDIHGVSEAIGRAWMMGARVVINTAKGRPCCRICGCTETEACEGGRAWAEPGLCTRCEGLE